MKLELCFGILLIPLAVVLLELATFEDTQEVELPLPLDIGCHDEVKDDRACADQVHNITAFDKVAVFGGESMVYFEGLVYTGTQDNQLVAFRPTSGEVKLAVPCLTPAGVPCRVLGLRLHGNHRLIGITKHHGIIRYNPKNTSEGITWIHHGNFGFLNDLVILGGLIYFTESMAGYEPRESILQRFGCFIPDGIVYRYDLRSDTLSTVLEGLVVPNGIEVSPDSASLIISEAGKFRLLRYDISEGTVSVFAERTLGAVDNIRRTRGGGGYWLGVSTVRVSSSLFDVLAKYPSIRAILTRFRVGRGILGLLLFQVYGQGSLFYQVDWEGRLKQVYWDEARTGAISEVMELEEDGVLLVGSPFGHHMLKVREAPSRPSRGDV